MRYNVRVGCGIQVVSRELRQKPGLLHRIRLVFSMLIDISKLISDAGTLLYNYLVSHTCADNSSPNTHVMIALWCPEGF